LRTLGKFDSKEHLLHFLVAAPNGLLSVGFVKRSSSPAKKPKRIDHNNRSANVAKQKDRGTYHAPGGFRRVREAVLVTRQKTPNASTPTIAR
jgi:hypothetical protein